MTLIDFWAWTLIAISVGGMIAFFVSAYIDHRINKEIGRDPNNGKKRLRDTSRFKLS